MQISENQSVIRPAWILPTPVRTDEPPPKGLKNILLHLMQGQNIKREEARHLLDELLSDKAADTQIS
ncbi:MAG TPA: hypothetical protein VGD05_06500, partial [Pyrinomonadaceae bacterium]